MSDNQRRLMCRIAFVVCCALPTILVANWILFPRSTAQWQSLVRQSIGCPVTIASVETPSLNEVRFHEFRFINSQAEPLAEFMTVDYRQTAEGPIINLSAIDLSLSQVSELVGQLLRELPQMEPCANTLLVQLPLMTIRPDIKGASSDRLFVARNCLLRVDSNATAIRAVLNFYSDDAAQVPVRWDFLYNRPSQSTSWKLNAENAVLPCWLLAKAWPASLNLGDGSWFGGTLAQDQSNGSTAYTLQDLQLLNLDVPKLLQVAARKPTTEPAPIRPALNSHFDATIGNARLVDGRVESLLAEIRCLQGGQLDPRWLQAAKKWLQVDVAESTGSAPLKFIQLLIGFEIRNQELFVWGDSQNGLIAIDANRQPLIAATAGSQRLSPQTLAAWLSGEEQFPYPVSAAALQILTHLPLVR